jgi:hypothetical protein
MSGLLLARSRLLSQDSELTAKELILEKLVVAVGSMEKMKKTILHSIIQIVKRRQLVIWRTGYEEDQ